MNLHNAYKLMKNKVFITYFIYMLCALASAMVYSAEQLPIYTASVINSYPHDSNAFTQGLVIEDGQLYEGTGRNGQSSLRLVEMESGELVKRRNLSNRYFGEGITIFDNKIYQLTWRSSLAFVYQLDSFDLLSSFYLPGEGWGITHDESSLIVSDGTAFLRFLDPESGLELHRIEVKDNQGRSIDRLNELEYINGEIWANVWYADYLIRINPETGLINSIVDLGDLYPQRDSAESVLNGIAWDEQAQRLFVTGKLWPFLYEIQVIE